MATKSSTKTKTKTADTKKKTTSKKTATKHDLLYIMSPQCGWCKKADPVVAELVEAGAKITTVDMTTPEGQARANEVKTKYNAQCGTPLFIDAETGNMKCGFAEKNILEKWAAGEEIPAPPQPKGPPPPPPADLETASKDEVNTWKEGYEKWVKENKHMPGLLPFDQIEQRVRQAQIQRKNQPQGQPGQPGAPAGVGTPTAGASNVSANFTFNNDFYYVVVNGNREVVMADTNYVQSLRHQYFQREDDGRLTKVVGDTNFNSAPRPVNNAGGRNIVTPRSDQTVKISGKGQDIVAAAGVKDHVKDANRTRKPSQMRPGFVKELNKKADAKISETKTNRKQRTKSKNAKGKDNTKTIESF